MSHGGWAFNWGGARVVLRVLPPRQWRFATGLDVFPGKGVVTRRWCGPLLVIVRMEVSHG